MKNQLKRRNRGNRIGASKAGSTGIEAMEARRMLSAAVHIHDHVLVIEGTRHADDITISEYQDRSDAQIYINGVTTSFPTSSFSKIRIHAGGGSDNVHLHTPTRALVFAGDGNDSIQGGDARDTLLGEAGDDYLFGNDGNDSLVGGAGKDLILGDNGNDRVFGNAQDDTLKGGLGDDFVSGGPGNDECHEGEGTDSVFGNRGRDHFMYTSDKNDIRDADPREILELEPTTSLGPICACNTSILGYNPPTNVGTPTITKTVIDGSTGSTLTTSDSGAVTTAAGTLTLSGVTINSHGNEVTPIIGVVGDNATMPTIVDSTISLVGQTIPHFVVAPGGGSIVPSGNLSGQWTGGLLGSSGVAVNHAVSLGGLLVSGGAISFGGVSSYTGSATLTINAGLFASGSINQSGTLGTLNLNGGGQIISSGLILGSDPIIGSGRISPLLPLVNTSSVDIGPVIDVAITDGGLTTPTTGNDTPPAPTDVGSTPTGNIGAGDPPSGNDPAIVEETVTA